MALTPTRLGNCAACGGAIALPFSFSFSAEIARLNATLAGWLGGQFATDSCWIEPPGVPEVAFHRNNTYVSSIEP